MGSSAGPMRLGRHFSIAQPREVDRAERLLAYLGIPALLAAALVIPTIVIDRRPCTAGGATPRTP